MTRNRRILLILSLAAIAFVFALTSHFRSADAQWRAHYRARAESYAWGEASLLEQIAEKLAAARQAEENGPEGQAEAKALRADAERLARLGAWHVKLEQKYAWAAEHPWQSLPPDPPPPE